MTTLQHSIDIDAPHPRSSALPALRPAWLIVGLVLVAFAVFEVIKHDLGPGPILVFAILPDLAFLVGGPHERGQLPLRAVPVYNALHRPIAPLVILVAATLGWLSVTWFVAGLAWLAHIAIDRGFGYGLRTAEGWIRG